MKNGAILEKVKVKSPYFTSLAQNSPGGGRCVNRKLQSWDREDYIFPKVTEMGSIFGHRIDYNGVGVLRGQRHIPSKN